MALKEPTNSKPQEDKQAIIHAIKSHPLYQKSRLWLFCDDDNECYVGVLKARELQEVVSFSINTPYVSYKLDAYSELQPYDFMPIRFNRLSFRPYVVIEVAKSGHINSSFLEHDDIWYYYSFVENAWVEHINQNDVIAYAKKKEYFPYIAGDVNER